jgi:predicted phosphodiesterase
MRVAALYDIHGNLPALDAVLAEVDALGVDRLVVGGDVSGGAFPRETVERLRGLGDRVLWLRGNCERELVDPPERDEGPAADDRRRALELLTDEQVAFLAGLPETVHLEIPGDGAVLFRHATPWNDLDIVTPLTSQARVERILEGVAPEIDVVVVGHTHMQEDRPTRPRWVNAGSVGMPYEDEDGAYWALLGPGVELRRTAYEPGDLGGYEYPQAGRDEAAAFFETLVVE